MLILSFRGKEVPTLCMLYRLARGSIRPHCEECYGLICEIGAKPALEGRVNLFS
jgi:hypothetical protein